MKSTTRHVVMPFIEYCGDVVTTPSNKTCKRKSSFFIN
jgi:hypothetical protein